MPSAALEDLTVALEEVNDLQQANPTPPGGLPHRPKVVRAINRSSVVLLYSHFERYFRQINEEALDLLNDQEIDAERIPEILRLEYSSVPINEIADMQWHHRSEKLVGFVADDAWLWGHAGRSQLDSARLLRWFTSPSPKKVRRFYRLWGIDNVFSDVTRVQHMYSYLWLKIQDLVDKRNNIAHGDLTAEATYQDIASYQRAVRIFSERADRRLGRALRRDLGVSCEW